MLFDQKQYDRMNAEVPKVSAFSGASAERAPLAKRAPPQVSSMRAPVASAASSSAVNVSGGRLALRFSR